jgi:phosphohistidine phosphatase
MKELFLIRHAKSDWGTEFLKDVDRPLNERGYSDAYFMSKWFLTNKKSPGLILSSTATRALNTALIFARALDFDMKHFSLEEEIYESTVSGMLSVIQRQDESVSSLMIFCHNPCVTEICNRLNDDVFIDNVPTCGIIHLHFETESWKEIGEKKGHMGFFQFPKDFRNQNDRA